MTGIMLISSNNKYADKNDSVSWGPKADKEWVRAFIEDKVVFVGYNTYETVKDLNTLKPRKWVVGEPTLDCQVHFGGYKTLWKYPPDKLIIHKTRFPISSTHDFQLPPGYVRVDRLEFSDYVELVYEKRW
jgi:dihydrofolate reductase